ncbi:MAG: HIRAN domain-containing protein [Lachnospiraceae bacterium]|nr:HIRAN domain-containing protein [Lachnospiraceae bacterium]
MAFELDVKKEGVVSLVEDTDLGTIIKPLVKEIHLFDSYVAGTTHLQDKSALETIQVGDSLILRREDNKFDSNAIQVLTEDGRKLGYVPEKDNVVFARLMDAGKLLKARISGIDQKGSFKRIAVGIYLVDF